MISKNIVGHELQKKILIQSIQTQKLSHSYLFQGPEGIGKKLLAIEFARLLNCQKELNSDYSKEECRCFSCIKTKKRTHPDIHILEYIEEKIIKVDHIRKDIEEMVFLSRSEGKYKIFILDNAERMNINAQNAFLKTLEEPPANSIIILISSLPHLLLPTIHSRCQILNFSSIDVKDVEKILQEKNTLNPEEIKIAARFSSGSIGKALRITQKWLRFRKEFLKCLTETSSENQLKIFHIVEKFDKEFEINNIEALRQLFEFLVSFLRDLIHIKTKNEESELSNPDLYNELKQIAIKKEVYDIVTIYTLIENTYYEISKLHINKRLALENLLFKIGV